MCTYLYAYMYMFIYLCVFIFAYTYIHSDTPVAHDCLMCAYITVWRRVCVWGGIIFELCMCAWRVRRLYSMP